jgi:hypothetical protein
MYHCLYNLELLILGTGQPQFQRYNEPIKKETPANYVKQLAGTDVDALMICPTAWKRPLWQSEVDPHWRDEAPQIKPRYFSTDLKYYEKAYFRLRDYILAGNDPVGETIKAAKTLGIAPFISYRMNDHHYHAQKDAFIHPKFWRDNEKYWLGSSGRPSVHKDNRHFNYMLEPVRDYYFSLLEELTRLYDIAGIELDFMRSPFYFAKEDLEAGKTIMTGFVKRISTMLDEYGKQRGKHLGLCVRVPHTVQECLNVGLNVPEWDKLGLLDMVNVSTFYITSPNIDVQGFKSAVKNTPCYGEIHFIVDKASIYNGFMNNVSRKTTKEMYRAVAADFLDRGIDGISLFNMDYTRDHHFNEPRRLRIKDGEPPFDVLCGITNPENLAKFDKHYIIGPHYSPLPMKNQLNIGLYVADHIQGGIFKHALLRLKTKTPCQSITIKAQMNGTELTETLWLGELFCPISNEGVAGIEYVKFYLVPVELIKHGINTITAKNISDDPTLWDKEAIFEVVELALYRSNSFLD